MGRIFATTLLIALCAACQSAREALPVVEAQSRPPPPAGLAQMHFRDAALAMDAGDCADLFKIKAAPHKAGDLGVDPYWDRIVVHAQHYRPCLVEAVADRTPVEGIVFGPGNPAYTVGDVAHALLVDLGFVEWGICVPESITEDPRGAVAAGDWLSHSDNRSAWESCLRRELAPK